MMKMGVLVKQMKTVETLGSASVICLDKTGTITQNKMSIAQLYILNKNEIVDFLKTKNPEEEELLSIAMWASEQSPFEQMEIDQKEKECNGTPFLFCAPEGWMMVEV